MVPQPEGHAGRVTAFGSVNLDLVIRGASVPGDGETVLAKSAASRLGGKGATRPSRPSGRARRWPLSALWVPGPRASG